MNIRSEKRARHDPSLFGLPIDKIKAGFYSDKYFVRTREILLKDNHHPKVLMQVFCRKDGILSGMDEAIAILKQCADRPDKLKIMALYDGDSIIKDETVMTIEGDYSTFAHLETLYLGCLARGSAIATSVKKVVDAAQNKPVLFFPARFDHYTVQSCDGYAAMIAGAQGVSTDANALWIESSGMGTIPHGLIAAYGGDTVKASNAFDRHIPQNVPRVALVDFDNNCVETALKVARSLNRSLWGVRLDTSGDLRDSSVTSTHPSSNGVCADLVFNVRKALDDHGFPWVKIFISGGFNEERIRDFVRLNVPFDGVGVGSWLLQSRIDFTADIVMFEGKPCSKIGRTYRPNPRLEEV